MLPEAYANISLALAAYKQIADTFQQEISVFANFPSNYLGLINEDESIEFTDGALRLIGPKGDIIEDGITAQRFTEVIGEAVEPYSYTKFVYYKPLGYPEGSYRVGPLARLNIVKTMGTPQADQELAEFKQLAAGPVESSFFYHHARLVEVLYGIEKIEHDSCRSADSRQACARNRRRESPGRRRPDRSAARNAATITTRWTRTA